MRILLLLLLSACATTTPPQPPVAQESAKTQAQAVSPFAGLASKKIIVLPVQYVGAGLASVDKKEYLDRLDSLITAAFEARGLRWTYAQAIARQAKRNSMVMPDAYALSAERLKATKLKNDQLTDPLASQIRSLVSLSEARYVLLPVEINADTTGKATLKVALLDARMARIVWLGGVNANKSDDTLADVAKNFADLVIAE